MKGFRNNIVLIPQSWYKKNISLEANNVLTKNYINIVHSKTAVFFKLLCLNQEFIFSDSDTVWLHEKVIEFMKVAQIANDAHTLKHGRNQNFKIVGGPKKVLRKLILIDSSFSYLTMLQLGYQTFVIDLKLNKI